MPWKYTWGAQLQMSEQGYGWFTHKLALRVGATGTVFAVDVQPAMVEDIRSWSVEEHLRQVIPVLGAENDLIYPMGSSMQFSS